MSIQRVLSRNGTIHSIGFDDGPFRRGQAARVPVAGAVCANTRLEGLVWGSISQDGWDATDVVAELLENGKFLPQLHLIFLDGIALGGFNVVDLQRLAELLDRPCVAVTRRAPDMAAVKRALNNLPDPDRRFEMLQRAGDVHSHDNIVFQTSGLAPSLVRQVLHRVTDRGHIPEPLRLAHLIATAVATGESGRRA